MSFRENDTQQLSFFSSLSGLTEREKTALDRSWAKVFADDIFPSIDEERFRCLYSDKASRPNNPVNVIIGALILKELFDLSDDEVVEDLMLDPRFQYALHTTEFEEQPLSDKSLTRFRQRCYDHERLTGEDIYHGCITDLAAKTAKMMKIDGRIRRMDSLMIEANIRKLSRMELIYKCIAKLVNYLNGKHRSDLIPSMEHYCEADDFNRVIYHSRSTDTDERMEKLLNDADVLLEKCGHDFDDITEYQLFVRCLSEQTTVEGEKRRLRTADDRTMTSGIMQSPADPDATYRSKAGRSHSGYVANVVEAVGESGSLVTDYQVETNNTSDSAMLKDSLAGMEPQKEKVIVVTDAAYSGTENTELAASKNIELITTDLTGRDVPESAADFELNEAGTKVLKCPAGHEPRSSSYTRQTGMCTASFDRDLCAGCKYKDQCNAKIFKRVAKIKISRKKIERAKIKIKMQTEEYRFYARLRNGVETIPSILKNLYHVDRMPVRRKIRCKFFIGAKISALNFRKLFRYRKGLGHYAKNPLLCGQ